jgi:hypothetical protein
VQLASSAFIHRKLGRYLTNGGKNSAASAFRGGAVVWSLESNRSLLLVDALKTMLRFFHPRLFTITGFFACGRFKNSVAGTSVNRPIAVEHSCHLPHTFEIRTGKSRILRPFRLQETQKVRNEIRPEKPYVADNPWAVLHGALLNQASYLFIYLCAPSLMHCFVLVISISTI